MRTEPSVAAKEPTRLVRCDFGVRGIPWAQLSRSAGAATIALVLVFASCAPALERDPGLTLAFGAVNWLAFLLVAFGSTTFAPLWRAARTRVWVDEGGLRLEQSGRRTYWPRDIVGGGKVEHQVALGGAALVLQDTTDRPFLKVGLFGGGPRRQAAELAQAVLVLVTENRAARAPIPPALERRGREVADWVRTLGELGSRVANQAPGFRSQSLDVDALLAVLEDRRLGAEPRAAAAYLLLRTERPALAERVHACLGPATPPLMTVLCELAARGHASDGGEPLREALEWLDADDRAALAELSADGPSDKRPAAPAR